METLLWVVLAISANMIVGAIVLENIDDKDRRLHQWYKDCPEQISWIAQPIALTVWPVWLWFWWINR